MSPHELNRILIRRFPALLAGYLETKQRWAGEEPGPHVVYGDLLVPHILGAIESGDSAALNEVMKFLEELSGKADSDVLDLLATSILEPLLGSKGQSELVEAMGPFTSKLWLRLLSESE